jgi:hypothetical protein
MKMIDMLPFPYEISKYSLCSAYSSTCRKDLVNAFEMTSNCNKQVSWGGGDFKVYHLQVIN